MDLPDLPKNTVAAFAALCGAYVVLTKKPDTRPNAAFTWSCLGCGDYAPNGNSKSKVIAEANAHAGLCRAVPLPTV